MVSTYVENVQYGSKMNTNMTVVFVVIAGTVGLLRE